MGWEDTTAPAFAGYVPTEGNRAKNGGRHPQEKKAVGVDSSQVAQTSGDGMAECLEPDGDD